MLSKLKKLSPLSLLVLCLTISSSFAVIYWVSQSVSRDVVVSGTVQALALDMDFTDYTGKIEITTLDGSSPDYRRDSLVVVIEDHNLLPSKSFNAIVDFTILNSTSDDVTTSLQSDVDIRVGYLVYALNDVGDQQRVYCYDMVGNQLDSNSSLDSGYFFATTNGHADWLDATDLTQQSKSTVFAIDETKMTWQSTLDNIHLPTDCVFADCNAMIVHRTARNSLEFVLLIIDDSLWTEGTYSISVVVSIDAS